MPKTVDPRNWTFKHSNKSHRDNYLKAVTFQSPDWIPCSVSFFNTLWRKYRDDLKAIVVRHPFIFGTFASKIKRNYDNIPDWHSVGLHSDNWGCMWQVVHEGYEGQVIGHPLADWNALDTYKFPGPLKFSERGRRPSWFWMKLGARLGKKYNILVTGSGERLFDRLYFLRGFDNLMRDIVKDDPHLDILINRLVDHELVLVKKWLEIGVDQVNFHTDIGMQDRLMISPREFRQHIKPLYAAIFEPCKAAKVPVYLSSDGNLLDIVDDLVEVGVTIHDPQLRANTLEGIQKHYKGKMCIDLDLDRQGFPFMSPEALKNQIKSAVDMLASPEGGLMMKAEFSDPNTPLENIEAVCQAFDEYCIPLR